MPLRFLPPNTREKHGKLCVRISVGGRRVPKSFALDPETRRTGVVSIALRTKIEQWIVKTEAALTDQRQAYGDAPLVGHRIAAGAATLDGDVPRRLAAIQGRVSWKSDASHLRAVCETAIDWKGSRVRVGSLHRDEIDHEVVQLMVAAWLGAPSAQAVRVVRVREHTRHGVAMPAYEREKPVTSGHLVATRTIKHRLRVLRELYVGLDGPGATHPVVGIKLPKSADPTPQPVDQVTIMAVAMKLAQATLPRTRVRPARDPDAYAQREAARQREALLTYVRYVVLVTTGQRPHQLMIAQPADVQFDAGTWLVRACKFGPAHMVVLQADPADPPTVAVQAWRAFMAANAWGVYDTSTHANRVHAAGWPLGIRPYNARHSLMTDALNEYDIDLADVQGLAGHTTPTTTRRFYAPVMVTRQRQVAKKLEGRLADLFKLRVVK